MNFAIEWDASQEGWQQALAGSDFYAYQQEWAYGEVMQRFGTQIHRAVVTREGAPVAVAQWMHRKVLGVYEMAVCMRGPVWCTALSDEEKHAVMRRMKKDLAQRLPWPRIMLWMPETERASMMRFGGFKRVMTGHHTVMLDLTQEEASLLAQMDGKWRNRLRAAEKEAVSIHPISKPTAYEWLFEHEIEQRARLGYQSLPAHLVPLYQEVAGNNSVMALAARQEGKGVGGMLCVIHGTSATYHIGWASEQGKAVNIHNQLLWEMMRALKQQGIAKLDLGGVNTDDSAGVARFKIGAGGEVVSLAGTFL